MSTTLDDNIHSSQVVVPVASAAGITPGDWVQIDSEKLIVTAVEGNRLQCSRGRGGTAPASHAVGSTVTDIAGYEGPGAPSAASYARVRKSTGTAGTGGLVVISFNVVEADTDGYYEEGSPTRLTVLEDGPHRVGFLASFAANEATHESTCFIRLNGSTVLATDGPSPSQFVGVGVTMDVGVQDYVAGDYFEVTFLADSGLDMSANCEFYLERV